MTLLEAPARDEAPSDSFRYDKVLHNIFHKYRSVDNHSGQVELTLEQKHFLEACLEIQEYQKFCRDFNIIGTDFSLRDMTAVCQLACFGRIIDPTKLITATDVSDPALDTTLHPLERV
eukprot:gene4743-2346_t